MEKTKEKEHPKRDKKIKIAAVGDIHINESPPDQYTDFFSEISKKADVLVLCGDLTGRGLPNEAKVLAKQLSLFTIPVVGVLGNHEFESGKSGEIKKILKEAHMVFLDDEDFEYEGVGFVGAKGFGGGFEKYLLGPFGEELVKRVVDEAVKEALILDKGLTRLQTKKKVVALHYAPIRQTCKGEPLEIYPFLGSSRLVEPIDNHEASFVFHGHAHHGSPEGKTLKGIPVYNVAYPLLEKSAKQPYALIEL